MKQFTIETLSSNGTVEHFNIASITVLSDELAMQKYRRFSDDIPPSLILNFDKNYGSLTSHFVTAISIFSFLRYVDEHKGEPVKLYGSKYENLRHT